MLTAGTRAQGVARTPRGRAGAATHRSASENGQGRGRDPKRRRHPHSRESERTDDPDRERTSEERESVPTRAGKRSRPAQTYGGARSGGRDTSVTPPSGRKRYRRERTSVPGRQDGTSTTSRRRRREAASRRPELKQQPTERRAGEPSAPHPASAKARATFPRLPQTTASSCARTEATGTHVDSHQNVTKLSRQIY